MTGFFAITSTKGGTGKTTIALNLATALMRFGREVVLVDANLVNPHIGLHLGTPNLPATLHDALQGSKHIRDVAYLHPSGLKVIPAATAYTRISEGHHQRLKPVLMDLIGTAEMVILDTPTGMGEHTKATLEAADEALIVTTPDIPAVTDAIKSALFCQQLGCAVRGVVVNRCTGNPDELRPVEIRAMLDHPVLGVFPEDPLHQRALTLQHPVQYTHPEAPLSVEIRKLAAKLIGQPYQPKLP